MKIVPFCVLLCVCCSTYNCRRPYEPPELKATNHFLVVDGVINATPDGTTTITLSRTRSFADTVRNIPEQGALVFVESKSGTVYGLPEKGRGVYILEHMNLDAANEYRLKITTASQSTYLSDFVPVKKSPPIDSLTWEYRDDVNIFAYTHDPQNQARYYRWDYTEDWQYHSKYETVWGVKDHLIYYRDTDQVYNCWQTAASDNIALGTSVQLSQDIIDHAPVARIPKFSEKLGVRYSILVRQYALSEGAYQYWKILEKNSQQVGSLFDPQPSQLKGNIHAVADPDEPVLGYVTASTVSEKRMFISHLQVPDWEVNTVVQACDTIEVPVNPADFRIYTYPNPTYVPYYFISGGPLVVINATCVDCTLRGGTTKKPAFW